VKPLICWFNRHAGLQKPIGDMNNNEQQLDGGTNNNNFDCTWRGWQIAAGHTLFEKIEDNREALDTKDAAQLRRAVTAFDKRWGIEVRRTIEATALNDIRAEMRSLVAWGPRARNAKRRAAVEAGEEKVKGEEEVVPVRQ
jgi:hypothetical protein